jgi:hypothetical protein
MDAFNLIEKQTKFMNPTDSTYIAQIQSIFLISPTRIRHVPRPHTTETVGG